MNLQSFLEICPMQKEVLPSHKLQGHAYEWQSPSRLKEDNITKKTPESIEPSRSVLDRARMPGEFDSRKDSQLTKFKQRPQIFVKLKLVSAIFYQFFIFSSNNRPSKTMKNVFYFIQKALFVLEIFKFLYFCPSLFFYQSAIALEDDRR